MMAYTIRVGRHEFNLKAITVEPVMFLYMLTTTTAFLTYQALTYRKVCLQNFNLTICDNLDNETFSSQEDIVQKTTSTWLLYSNLALAIPSLFSVGLFLGPWGDAVGRKIPILCPIIGMMLSAVSVIVNSVFMAAPLEYLLIGPCVNGLLGGYIGAMMAMYSYVANISTFEHKTVKMGIVEAMIFLSGTVGTVTSGIMLDNTSYVFVFSFCLCVMFIALLYAILWIDNIIPEKTDSDSQPETKGWCRTMVVGSIKDAFLCVYGKRHNKNFWNLMWLMVLVFFLMMITVGEGDILLVFTRGPPLAWSQTTLGLYKGTESFLRGIAVLTILPLLKRKFKTRDTTLNILGFISKTAILVVLGVATATPILFIGGVLGVLQGFSSAAIRSMSSSMVQANEQAKLFSLIAIIENLSSLAATNLFNNVYNATLNFYHGFCFLMAAGISGLLIIIAVYLHFNHSDSQTYETLSEEVEVESGSIVSGNQPDDDLKQEIVDQPGTIQTGNQRTVVTDKTDEPDA